MTPYYEQDGITIYNTDCLECCDELSAGSFAGIITDPPYSSGTRKEGQKGVRKSMVRSVDDAAWFGTDCLTTNGFLWMMRACARDWRRLLIDGGHILSFIDWRMMPALSGAIESADLRHAGLLVWNKVVFGMGACFRNQHELILHFTKGVGREPARRDCPNVLSVRSIRNGEHDTEKPLALLTELVSVVSHPGELILDPFMGIGTTLIAARQLGRRAVGIEIGKEYCDIAIERLAQSILAFTPVEIIEPHPSLFEIGIS